MVISLRWRKAAVGMIRHPPKVMEGCRGVETSSAKELVTEGCRGRVPWVRHQPKVAEGYRGDESLRVTRSESHEHVASVKRCSPSHTLRRSPVSSLVPEGRKSTLCALVRQQVSSRALLHDTAIVFFRKYIYLIKGPSGKCLFHEMTE